jgi:hypothetical protein
VSNSNKETRQLLSFAKKVCRELVEMWEWQVLTDEQTFTSDGTGEYDFSSIVTDDDYDRPVTETEWDRTNQKKIVIVTAQEWQYLKSGLISNVGIYRWARVRGDKLLITPDDSGDTLVLEYVSSFYAKDSGGTKKATFTADTDSPRFKENLVELGLKAYIKSEYGLPAEEDFDRYYDSAEKLIAQERPLKVIRPTRPLYRSQFVVNIPDSGAGA